MDDRANHRFPTVVVEGDASLAAARAADRVVAAIGRGVTAGRDTHIALAGGTTPERTYRMVAELVPDWRGVHLWPTDERHVPEDDPHSNHRMIDAALAAIPQGRGRPVLHGPPTAGTLAADCAAFAAEIGALVPRDPASGRPALDLAILGLGEDGHTASLFPHHPALECDGVCAPVPDAPKPPPARISLTLALLATAGELVILATGSAKAAAVQAMLGEPNPATPASLLPMARTTLICDRAAAPPAEY